MSKRSIFNTDTINQLTIYYEAISSFAFDDEIVTDNILRYKMEKNASIAQQESEVN